MEGGEFIGILTGREARRRRDAVEGGECVRSGRVAPQLLRGQVGRVGSGHSLCVVGSVGSGRNFCVVGSVGSGRVALPFLRGRVGSVGSRRNFCVVGSVGSGRAGTSAHGGEARRRGDELKGGECVPCIMCPLS